MSDIRSHGWWTFVFSASLTVLIALPLLHSYMWLVVKSLRRQMLTQIHVDFGPTNNNNGDVHLTRTELALYKMIHDGRGDNGRP